MGALGSDSVNFKEAMLLFPLVSLIERKEVTKKKINLH